jgi:hypothetical protein
MEIRLDKMAVFSRLMMVKLLEHSGMNFETDE